MRYIFDHDLHLHSGLSLCSGDAEQTPQRMLQYAEAEGLKTLCLTDHFWDENVPRIIPFGFYDVQNYDYISKALPLPEKEGIRFLFGAETDLDMNCTLGLSRECFDRFDFVIIPTTHLHMDGFTCRGNESTEERAKLWVSRLDAVLDMDIPFRKVGIAHLTCELMNRGHAAETLDLIPDSEFHRVFARCADKGCGIELNFNSLKLPEEKKHSILRCYRIAKEEGCKFYFGSDAHHPGGLNVEKANAENIIDLLDLEESDKFII